MKNIYKKLKVKELLLNLTFLFFPLFLLAGPGDTTIVKTFTYDSIVSRRGIFTFPEKGKRYEKILMYYTLKCDSLTPLDKYPCGEWDYTTYTRIWHNTGKMDSTRLSHPDFIAGGISPKEYFYSSIPTYSYFEYWKNEDQQKPDDSYILMDGNDHISVPAEAFKTVSDQLTISFWLKGDVSKLPAQSTVFEGLDSKGKRVINLHVPYDNGIVYWDAGGHGDGLTDNINVPVSPSDYKGRWTHWTVTKNNTDSVQRIYMNGKLIKEGKGLFRKMDDIRTFMIGSNGKADARFYPGGMDDFAVWNKALDEKDIASLANGADPVSIDKSNLLFYYSFNEDDIKSVLIKDDSGNGYDATAFGMPQFIAFGKLPGHDFKPGKDFNLARDSIENARVSIVMFADSLHPELPTDTLLAWPGYNFIFNGQGIKVDSSLADSARSLNRKTYVYYTPPTEIVEPFEIARFITPYGKRLDLGLHGFTWVYDVSDYEPLLHGQVDLQAGNGQELIDLRFIFIEGIPPRDVIAVHNIWPEGSYKYKDLADDKVLKDVAVNLSPEASTFMIRTRISGHGQVGPFACCEWDPKEHFLDINGKRRFDWKVWRDCGMNPVHPQGGTWQFDRAGWCPGTFVDTYDFELTPYVKPGNTCMIDYDIQPYNLDNGEEEGNFEMAMQLFEFSAPNYQTDASLEDILAPSRRQEYSRLNPVSQSPVIRIRNTGSDTLRSVKVKYGLEGNAKSEWEWTGKLGFMESADLILPKTSWNGMKEGSVFEAALSEPNGKKDEHPQNDYLSSHSEAPVILPSKFILYVKTQGFGRAADNAYTIKDADGKVVYHRDTFKDSTEYFDRIRLKPGAYELEFTDKEQDGMIRHWWMYWEDKSKVGGNGALKILDAKKQDLMDLGYDWAEKRVLRFFVGEPE